MTLTGGEDGLSVSCGHPTMLAVRQQEFCMEANVRLSGTIAEGQCAGLSAFYTSEYHYDILVTRREGALCACLRKRVADIDVVVASHPIEETEDFRLGIESDAEWYTFFYEKDGERVNLGRGKTALLCTEATHPTTFTGVYWGVFCEDGTVGVTHFAVRRLK